MTRYIAILLFFISITAAFAQPKISVVSEVSNMRARLGSPSVANIYIINSGSSVAFIEGLALSVSNSFSVLPSNTFPYLLQSNETLKVAIQFAPTSPCSHKAFATLRTTGLTNKPDTIIQISGIGVVQKLSSKDNSIFLGTQLIGQFVDSTTYDFIGVYDFTGNLDACLASTMIDSVVINDPTNSFKLIYPLSNTFPRTCKVGQFLTFTLRFQPQKIGNLFADMKLYFGGSADSVRKIKLSGRCFDEYIKLNTNLGKKITGKPGQLIRVPIVLTSTSEVFKANINLLEINLKFKKTVLKPKAVYAVQNGVIAEPVLPYRFDDPYTAGIARIRLTHQTTFSPGVLAEVEFAVMIGDTQSTFISYKDIKSIYRPEIAFITDSVLFMQDDFCDKPARVINYNFSPLFAKQNNNEITIGFYQPEFTSSYQVQVLDESGRLVKLMSGDFEQGNRAIKLDATDFYSGRYFIAVKRGELIEKTKMFVVR